MVEQLWSMCSLLVRCALKVEQMRVDKGEICTYITQNLSEGHNSQRHCNVSSDTWWRLVETKQVIRHDKAGGLARFKSITCWSMTWKFAGTHCNVSSNTLYKQLKTKVVVRLIKAGGLRWFKSITCWSTALGLVTMASKLSSFTAFAIETVSWGISLPIFDWIMPLEVTCTYASKWNTISCLMSSG